MSSATSSELIIQGLTKSGKTFRPSDWAERLCGVFSTYGADHRMSFSPYVKPVTINGVKCVKVGKALQQAEPSAYNFLLDFARENDLQVIDDAETGKGAEA